MCYDDEARPPVPPGESHPAQSEDLVLSASDGNRFAAYFATPTSTPKASIIIYPDVRGLHQFYKELALRFAESGVAALAIDYFGRTAGLSGRDELFEYMPHVQQLKVNSFSQDVQAGIDYLHEKVGANSAIFVVGFCMGGSFTLLTGMNSSFHFAGLLPFYAGLSRAFGGGGTVLDEAAKIVYPVQGFFGGADQNIPESDVNQLDEKLSAAKIDHTLTVYPGAPHSFFDRRSADFAEASSDAWSRALAFIDAHKN